MRSYRIVFMCISVINTPKITIKLLKDECALMIHDCHANANCIDDDVGFRCECWKPFEDLNGDGRTCIDFDECTDWGSHKKILKIMIPV